MPLRPLSTACAALALAVSALLGGCGGSSSSSSHGNGLASKTPDQIVEAAQTAALGAASVHVNGSIISEKKPISLNMELLAGKGAKGRMSLEGLSIDLVDVENAFYLSGSTAFYTHIAGSAAAQLLQGKWLKAPATSGNFASLAQLTNLRKLVEGTLANHGVLKGAGTATIDGRPAVGVTDATKGGTLYVAATGTPYPLEITENGREGGRITFDRWNKPVTLTAPANAINIDQLENGH